MSVSNIHITCPSCGNTYPQDPYHEGYPGGHACVGGMVRTVSYMEQMLETQRLIFPMQVAAAQGLLGRKIRTVSMGLGYDGTVLMVSTDVVDQQILVGLDTGESFDFTTVETITVEA